MNEWGAAMISHLLIIVVYCLYKQMKNSFNRILIAYLLGGISILIFQALKGV